MRGKDEFQLKTEDINELVRNGNLKIEMGVDREGFGAVGMKMVVETNAHILEALGRQKVGRDKKRPMIQFWETLTPTGRARGEQTWVGSLLSCIPERCISPDSGMGRFASQAWLCGTDWGGFIQLP